MKYIPKYSILLFALISFSLVWVSCSKDSQVDVVNDDIYSSGKSSPESESYTVVSVTEDSTIVSEFIETELYDSIVSTTNSSPQLDSAYKLVFDTTALEVLTIPISDTDSTSRSIYCVYHPDSNIFLGAFIFDVWIRDIDSSTRVKLSYPNGEPAISVVADNSNHIISVSSNQNPIYEPVGGMDCIINCFEAAMSACMDDFWCAIECALCFEYCVAAITISCTYHCLIQTGVLGQPTG
jgi:hypothetical protein